MDLRGAALADLTLLDITTDQQTDSQAWTETLKIAELFQLAVYDAAYLELARRRNLPLATLDQELRTAVTAFAVKLGARTHKSSLIGAGLTNVRYGPGSDQIPHRSEMTRCARFGSRQRYSIISAPAIYELSWS